MLALTGTHDLAGSWSLSTVVCDVHTGVGYYLFFLCLNAVGIIYVPQTGQRLHCCLLSKLNIDKAPAFTPDFIVLTNMFSLQNNLDLIIHQKRERPLSFSVGH